MLSASCMFDGYKLAYLPVLNPGRWCGKTWLIELIGGAAPVWVVVEAGSISDAIEVLSNDAEFGHAVHALTFSPDAEPEYDNRGRLIDTERVRVHGRQNCDFPYTVRYHDEGFPAQGIDPRRYAVAQFN